MPHPEDKYLGNMFITTLQFFKQQTDFPANGQTVGKGILYAEIAHVRINHLDVDIAFIVL